MSIENILKNKLVNNEISLVNVIIKYKEQMELSEKINLVHSELINKCIMRSKSIKYFYNTSENLLFNNEFEVENSMTKILSTINEDYKSGYDMEKWNYTIEFIGDESFIYLF